MASCSSTAYDGGVISLSGTCGFCNLAFSVSIVSPKDTAQRCIEYNGCPGCVNKLQDRSQRRKYSIRDWCLKRHCATLGCTNVFRCSKIPASGILQHINPQLSFHCPVCCDRASAAALHTEDADAGNPLLATPDSPKAADVASYSMYKWICAPIAAHKREHGGAQGATIQQPTDDYPFASVSAPSPHSDISLSAADLAELDQLEADYAGWDTIPQQVKMTINPLSEGQTIEHMLGYVQKDRDVVVLCMIRGGSYVADASWCTSPLGHADDFRRDTACVYDDVIVSGSVQAPDLPEHTHRFRHENAAHDEAMEVFDGDDEDENMTEAAGIM
ncbi:hypothetical protein OEZ85_003519 [Tetradesmus obliquus]|uniref:RING-type domain-containing protein n=1 Tax=Tetradesmus obliquus TaxID=3088 RepID=A0ABY8UC14_TETOB|nr:hypothetical protein OEZ85_003519 [Tetradesmus obliquus]